MNHTARSVTLRPRTYIVLVIIIGFFGMGTLVLFAAMDTREVDQFVWSGMFWLAGVLIGVNFLHFCFTRISERGIERVNYFGMVRQSLPIDQVKFVGLPRHRNIVLKSVPSLVVDFASGEMEFSAAKYHERSLLDAAVLLTNLGVATQPDLLPQLHALAKGGN
jgi:hypothetical protein